MRTTVCAGSLNALDVGPDNSVAVALADYSVAVFPPPLDAPGPVDAALRLRGHVCLVRFILFCESKPLLVTACRKWASPSRVVIWDLSRGGRIVGQFQRWLSVCAVAAPPSSDVLATSWEDASLRVYSMDTFAQIACFQVMCAIIVSL